MNKDKLKKNAFWLALGGGGAAILIFFYVFVWMAMGDRDLVQKRLKGSLDDLGQKKADAAAMPSKSQIEILKQRKDDLVRELDHKDPKVGIKAWYLEYDRELEKWFPELKTAGDAPTVANFKAQYNDRINKFEKDLAEGAKIELGIEDTSQAGILPTGSQSGLKLNWDPEPSQGNIRDLQKKFWVRERVKNALLEVQKKGGGVVRLEGIQFLPNAAGAPGEMLPGWPESTSGALKEYDLAGGYGSVITCGVRAVIHHPQVPRFLRFLLDRDGIHPRMLVHLRGARITVIEPMEESLSFLVNVPPDGDRDALKAKKEAEVRPQPPPVRVYATFEVVDFDEAKLAVEFKPPPQEGSEAPPAEGGP